MAAVIALLTSCSGETITLVDPEIYGGQLVIEVEKNHEILYQVEPEGTPVTWTSSDPGVAFIVGNWISAQAAGTAEIVGTTPKGGTASFNVYVKPFEVQSFSIPASLSLYLNKTKDITVSNIVPEEAKANSIEWRAAGDNISWTIEDNTLHILGIKVGTTELIGTGTGGASESCKITVLDSKVSLSQEGVSFVEGASDPVTISVRQDPDIYNNFSWSTSDSGIASISPNGNECTITPGTSGKATVSVQFGDHELKCAVAVVGSDYQPYFQVVDTNSKYSDMESDWPCDLIDRPILADGSTVYVVPNEVAVVAKNWSEFAWRWSYNQVRVCLENGEPIPVNFFNSLRDSYSDPSSISTNYTSSNSQQIGYTDRYYHFEFPKYAPDRTVSLTVTSGAGKKCTVYYKTEVKKIGLSYKNGYTRKDPVITENGGKITLKSSNIIKQNFYDLYSVDMAGSEFDGYCTTKKGCLYSSNTNVAKVSNTNFDPYNGKEASCLYFSGCSTGTTTISVKNSSGVVVASFTLEVTN